MRFLGAVLYMINRTFKRMFCRRKQKASPMDSIPIKRAKDMRESRKRSTSSNPGNHATSPRGSF